MSIDLSAPPVPFSFEVYPPRSEASTTALHETIRRLAAAGPRFISVTYGAGGSTGGRSLDLLRFIRSETPVSPLAHLTCVGNTYAGANSLIREFLDAGITSFLALRGDPPAGTREGESFLGELESSAQLVQLIDRVQAERAPYTEASIPGVPGARGCERRPKVDIAVAAFPNGHPRSRHPREHIDALLAKQAAGATLAITQVFFHADDYLAFVQRSRAAGVTIPILPGHHAHHLAVAPAPRARAQRRGPARRARHRARRRADDRRAATTSVSPSPPRLAREVVAGGAPGIHLYAFNDHRTVLAVLRDADVLTPPIQKEAVR